MGIQGGDQRGRQRGRQGALQRSPWKNATATDSQLEDGISLPRKRTSRSSCRHLKAALEGEALAEPSRCANHDCGRSSTHTADGPGADHGRRAKKSGKEWKKTRYWLLKRPASVSLVSLAGGAPGTTVLRYLPPSSHPSGFRPGLCCHTLLPMRNENLDMREREKG